MGNTAVTVTGGTAEQRALTFNVTQQMYDKDPAFKQAIDSKAASGESIRLEDTPEGIGGLAVTAGNVMAVDPKKDVGDNQDYANTIAHELSHNMGLDHSPELFAFAEHAGSTVA